MTAPDELRMADWPSIPSRASDPVLAAAVRSFTETGTLDLRAVAKQAGVGRATLYRRFADRETLLGEVLWELVRSSLTNSRRRAGTGVDGVVGTLHRTMSDIVAFPALRILLDRAPDIALRVLTSRNGCVQRRVVLAVEELILDEIGEPVDISAAQLSFALVRLAESFCYADVIAGHRPDVESATEIMRRLLRD